MRKHKKIEVMGLVSSILLLAGASQGGAATEIILPNSAPRIPVDPQALMSFPSRVPSPAEIRTVHSQANGALRNLVAVHDRIYTLIVVGRGLVFNKARSPHPLNQQLIVWEGNSWQTMAVPLQTLQAIHSTGNDLLAIGSSTNLNSSSGLTEVVLWNGANWTRLTDPFPCDSISAVAVENENIYLGGKFPKVAGPWQALVHWDGKTWKNPGADLVFEGGPGATRVSALLPRGAELFVGGKFTRVGKTKTINVARLLGGKGFALGSGLEEGKFWENGALGLAFAGTNLLAVSSPPGNKSLSTLWKWNGKNWGTCVLPMQQIGPMISDGGNGVIVAGAKGAGTMGSAAHVLQYDLTEIRSYGEIPVPLLSQTSISASPSWTEVTALAMSGTNIFAGGTVTFLSTSQFPFVAKWNGNEWKMIK